MSLPNELLPVGLLGKGPAGGYQISRSLRFNRQDSAHLVRIPGQSSNRSTWTWAGWIKIADFSVTSVLFNAGNGSNGFSNNFWLYLQPNPSVGDGTTDYLISNAVLRDPSAWYHLVFSCDTTQSTATNRFKIYINGLETTYLTDNRSSLTQNSTTTVNSTNSHYIGYSARSMFLFPGYLADVHFIDGQALTPTSFGQFDSNGVWQPKSYSGTYGTNGFRLDFSDNSSATSTGIGKDASGNGNNWTPTNFSVTTFNPFSWVWTGTGGVSNISNAFDTNLTTYATSVSIGNGQDESIYLDIDTSSNPIVVPSGQTLDIYTYQGFGNGARKIRVNGGAYVLDDANGKCSFAGPLTITSIRSTLGPGAGNGFSAIISGFVLNGVTLTYSIPAANDSLVDSPTNYGTDTGAGGEVRGNYCTLNPLLGTVGTLSNGNLDGTTGSTINHRRGTFGVTSGKWYWEFTANSASDLMFGVVRETASFTNASTGYPGGDGNGWGYYQNSGTKYNGLGAVAYGASYTTGDIIGVALDADAGTLTFYKNGVSQGQAFNNLTSGPFFPAIGNGSAADRSYSCNFGQRPFAYAAPSGFKALCTQNLPTPTIPNGRTAMDVVTDTGANILATAQAAIGGAADLYWIKDRANANNHQIIDAVRGGTLTIQTNTTNAETTYSAPSGSSVAWVWDAGTTTVTNTAGTITSQVRANASAGISIVSWTGNTTNGATVGHGLNVIPSIVIYKNRSAITNWIVNATPITGTGTYLILNGTNATASNAQYVLPTSSTLVLPSYSDTNGGSMIAYCFAPVSGFSAFGSYTGNGSADGPFVFCNFSPKWILLKRTDTTGNWYVWDTARDTFNVASKELYPNLSNAEATNADLDILSNGFKIRATTADFNANAGTYIYAAFASNPFTISRAR